MGPEDREYENSGAAFEADLNDLYRPDDDDDDDEHNKQEEEQE